MIKSKGLCRIEEFHGTIDLKKKHCEEKEIDKEEKEDNIVLIH